MTTPTSGAISILNVRNEFAEMHGAYNDMNSWNILLIGEASTSPVSMSDFYGKTKEWLYAVALGYPSYSGVYAIGTAFGSFSVTHANDPGYHQFAYYDALNPTATSRFYGLYTPAGFIAKAYFNEYYSDGSNTFFMYSNFSGPTTAGTMYWAFR